MNDGTKMLSVTEAAELYSELLDRPAYMWRTHMCRLVSGGKLGVEGVDWGRLGAGKTSMLWVTETAVRRFAAIVRDIREAERARMGDVWSRRAERAAMKAAAYRAKAEP